MLDLLLFRADKGGDPFLVRESQRRRRADVAVVDAVVEADARWRKLQRELDDSRAMQAKLRARARPPGAKSKKAAAPAVDGPPPTREELAAVGAAIAVAERAAQSAQSELQALLQCVGNLVHEDAPLLSAQPAGRMLSPDALRRRLIASGFAEPIASGAAASGAWRAVGDGLLLQQRWLAHALGFMAARGFELLHAPLQAPMDRLAKLDKARRGRGEQGMGAAALATRLAADPLGALHACRCDMASDGQ